MIYKWIRTVLPVLLLGLFSWLCAIHTKSAVFFSSHDGEYMLLRSFAAAKALSFHEFPIHWSQSLNHYCGVPVFKFFYPLWHWIAAIVAITVQVPLVSVVTTLYALTFFASSIGMYGWLRSEKLSKWGSLVGSLLYLLAPYRMVNVYVRGSIESFGYALLPLLLWSFSYFYRRPDSIFRLLLACLAFTAFSLSHNLVVFLSLPLIAGYCIFQSIRLQQWIPTVKLGLCSLLLAGFFWFPAILDQKFTRLVDQKTVIAGNLLSISQLIYSPWGYTYQSGSQSGIPPRGISFSVGIAQLIGVSIALIVAIAIVRTQRAKAYLLTVLIAAFSLYFFLATTYSLHVWERVMVLGIIQFPFRLLGPLVFLSSLLSALSLSWIRNALIVRTVVVGLSLLSLYSVRNYLRPNPVNDAAVFSSLENHPLRFSSTGISDEILSRNDPQACTGSETIIDLRSVSAVKRETTERTGRISFQSSQSVVADFNLALSYFPEQYQFQLNGASVRYTEEDGRVRIVGATVREGENVLTWTIQMNRVERWSLLLSFFTFGLLLCALGMQGITRISKTGAL